jgi:biopolymer transport protein ExbD
MGRVREEEEGEMSFQIAPMINLMLVILAAMTTTLGVVQKELELGIKVPGEATESSTQPQEIPLEVVITSDGTILYNRSPIDVTGGSDLPQLKSRLKKATELYGAQPVIIRPQLEARHERVIDVLNACSFAGVKNLTFGEAR